MLASVIDRLEAHGVKYFVTADAFAGERFRIAPSELPRPSQGTPKLRTLTGQWEASSRPLPAGSLVVRWISRWPAWPSSSSIRDRTTGSWPGISWTPCWARIRRRHSTPCSARWSTWRNRMRRTEAFAVAALAAASLATAQLLPRPAPVEAGLALAVAWAGLLLYVPVRAAAGWCWRQVAAAAPREADRRALGLVLVLGVGLLAWGIDWGLVGHSWAADELRPDWVRDVLRKVSSGWYDKYPWLHYAVLAVPMAGSSCRAVRPVAGGASRGRPAGGHARVGCDGLATLVAAFLCAVRSSARAGRRWPCVAHAALRVLRQDGQPRRALAVLVRMAMVAFLRIAPRACADYVLAVASAGAVARRTRPANLAPWRRPCSSSPRRETSRTWWGKLGSALAGRQVLRGGRLGLGSRFSITSLQSAGAVAHFAARHARGLGDRPGNGGGLREAGGPHAVLFRWSLGWPFFALAVLGIASAAARPGAGGSLALVVPLSFTSCSPASRAT